MVALCTRGGYHVPDGGVFLRKARIDCDGGRRQDYGRSTSLTNIAKSGENVNVFG
jgi:hypothetical protein